MQRGSSRCLACGTEWEVASARYCGRCGAALDVRSSTTPSGSRRGRGSLLVVAIGGIVLAVGLAVLTNQLWGAPDERAAQPDWDVELPDEDAPADDATLDLPVAFPSPEALGCEPQGCEAWRTRLTDGRVAVADDRIVHTSASDVIAVDILTGQTLWSHRYSELGIPPVVQGARPHVLDAGSFAVSFADGGVQSRDLDTGQRRWHVELDLDHVDDVALHDQAIVVTGWGRLTREVQVIGLAADSGDELWRARVDRAVTVGSDPLLLLLERGELAGVDPGTGSLRWTRPSIGPVTAHVGGEAHALISPTGVEALDPASGQTRLRLPRPVSNAGPTRLFGRLLLTNLPAMVEPGGPQRTEVLGGDVRTGVSWSLPDVTGVASSGEGVVLVQQQGRDLTLRGFDLDADERWVREVGAPDDVCCWTAHAGPYDGTVLVVPPSLDRQPVRLVEVVTGQTVASLRRPGDVEREELDWRSGLGVDRRDDRAVLVGPGGSVTVPAHAELLTLGPRPVLRVGGGLLGLDGRLLMGRSESAPDSGVGEPTTDGR